VGCVKRIVTDLAVLDIDYANGGGFILKEVAPGVSIEEVKKATAGKLSIAKDIKVIA